jgi:hypothetical protein
LGFSGGTDVSMADRYAPGRPGSSPRIDQSGGEINLFALA